MENEKLPEPSKEAAHASRNWLTLLLKDCDREAVNASILGAGMLARSGRTMVWTICRYFECDRSTVPSLTCRVLEQYVANLSFNRFPSNALGLWDYLEARMWLLVACSYQLAAKATSSHLRVGPRHIRDFLLTVGWISTVEDVIRTEWAVFAGINFYVPLYNSAQMGEMLAEHVGVHAGSMIFIVQTVQLAEMFRHEVEAATRNVVAQRRIEYGNPRVYTLHLVAGCVAAALKKAYLGEPERTARQLATTVRVTSEYIEALRDSILSCISSDLDAEIPWPRRRPNILRKNTGLKNMGRKNTGLPYSRPSGGPEPGTSK